MAKIRCIPILKQEPQEQIENADFKLNLQRALLLTLLNSKKLSQTQFEECLDKLIQKQRSCLKI